MTLDELTNFAVTTEASEGLEITEYPQKGYTIVKSPKRSEAIRITTEPRFGHCKILYESGKSVPGLDGTTTSMSEAIRRVKRFLATAKMTTRARYKDRPIADPPKQKRGHKPNADSDNENVNIT